MNAQTPDITLPDLPDDSIARIEEAVFERIADERTADRKKAERSRSHRRRGWLTAGGIAAAFVVGVMVTPAVVNGLGGASGSFATSVAEDSGGAPAPESAGGGVTYDTEAQSDAGSAVKGADPGAPAEREIIQTGSATVRVDDIRAGAETLSTLAEKHGGFVESQDIGAGGDPAADGDRAATSEPALPRGDDYGWLTVRVPAAELSALMDELGSLGEVTATSVGKSDVTAVAVDLRARIESSKASVQRLTELMAQAGSVADLLAAETALTDRQAQLEGYEQQLKDLETQVDMSTLSVSLTRTADPVKADPAGFGDGLAAGWTGLIATLNGLVVAFGFLLPWLVIAGAAALVVWGVIRLRRRRHPARAETVDRA